MELPPPGAEDESARVTGKGHRQRQNVTISRAAGTPGRAAQALATVAAAQDPGAHVQASAASRPCRRGPPGQDDVPLGVSGPV